MSVRPVLGLLALAAAAWCQQALPKGSAADSRFAIEAVLAVGKEEVKSILGADPGENIVVIEVKFTPKKEGKFYFDHDEFLLRSDRDGQSARPLHPTQIAGSSVMVISSRGGTQGSVGAEQRRVPYGVPGIPGSGRMPPSLPGSQPPAVGSSTADTSEAAASIEEKKTDATQKALLEILKAKRLPEGEIEGPVSGLLYFSFEGKHKVKHFELVYRRAPPRLSVRFVEPKKK